jgi:hypothetical protein
LQYREPTDFSFAAHFDVNEKDFEKVERLRITVSDFLGHEYVEIVEAQPFMKRAHDFFLVQDGPNPIPAKQP